MNPLRWALMNLDIWIYAMSVYNVYLLFDYLEQNSYRTMHNTSQLNFRFFVQYPISHRIERVKMETKPEFNSKRNCPVKRAIVFPDPVPTDRFYGSTTSLGLQMKANVYMQTLKETIHREKNDAVRKQIKQMNSTVKK